MKRFPIAVALTGAVASVALASAFASAPHPGGGRTIVMRATGTAKLTIVHVARGCHSWTNGDRIGETVRLTLDRGGRVVIVNQDVDAHKLVQTAGPKVVTGAPMMMNSRRTIVFRQAGMYHLKTRTVEMPGMPEIDTAGPDHALWLTVTVKR